MGDLLTDIEIFLRASGMSATRFGRDAVGDQNFVFRLRKKTPYLSATEEKARQFMLTYARG